MEKRKADVDSLKQIVKAKLPLFNEKKAILRAIQICVSGKKRTGHCN